MALLDLLIARLEPQAVQAGAPAQAAAPARAQAPARPPAEYRGSAMPEVTPFSNQALPSLPPSAPAGPPAAAKAPADGDAVSRLNELFPEEEAGFMPNNDDITSILDRLLPDEERGAAVANPGTGSTTSSSSSRQVVSAAPQGYAVFLAKITDDARRAKVVGILQELAKLSAADADALSKKVIIPVLKGVTKEEAEAAKQRFAKIGILARVKGPEGG
jgi:ribosomal protein L7/L12